MIHFGFNFIPTTRVTFLSKCKTKLGLAGFPLCV